MAEAKGPADFTGYWVLSKVEQLDEFLKALGFPWVVRKAAAKFGSCSCDVIAHTGTIVRVTSLNPKGSWTRTYDTENLVEQLNAEGVKCKTTSWWEGNVLHSRLEGSPLGTCESWRYRRGDTLVVKTSVKRKADEQEATCFWYFELMQALQRHIGGESMSKAQLLKALAADQKRVQQATRKDNAYLQKVLLDWDRWSSPADEFIRVLSPLPYAGVSRTSRQPAAGSQTSSRLRSRASPAGSPSMGVSQSPSTSSLSGLASNQDGGRSRLTTGGGNQPGGHFPTSRSAAELSALANAAPTAIVAPMPTATSPGSEGPSPGGGGGGGHARKMSVESAGPSGATSNTSAVAAAATAAAVASVSRKTHHYRSPSADSVNIGQFTPGRGAGCAGVGAGTGTTASQSPPTGPEALMVFKLHEFLDGRGIASVVPVTHPNDTNEPQLLGMSPEQAEETAVKLRELETDMLLRRQEHVNGFTCCGLVLSRENDTLPDHLRVWEMTLA